MAANVPPRAAGAHSSRSAHTAGARLGHPRAELGKTMDAVYLVIIVALYASTHWLVKALSRLRGEK